jgi:NAD+ synthase
MFDAKSVKERIIVWITDYFRNNASPEAKAVIGISGGKDSSVAAALCAEALGKERVLGVLMPQGVQDDIDISYELCETLGIPYTEIDIGGTVQTLYDEIVKNGIELNDIARFNTPARIRMTVLYAISGIAGGRVVNTSNLSEDRVGYTTKFGDTAGDLGPISDLTAAEVKAIGRELGLAPRFIDKVPADGLCGRTDEESFGFTYELLDKYIREGVCENASVKEKIDRLCKRNLHKVNPMPVFRLNEQTGE